MRATQFFLMSEAATKLKAQENVDACYIARIPAVDKEGFETYLEYYSGMIERTLPKKPELPPQQVMAGSQQAFNLIQNLYANDPRVVRKPHRVEH
jgi:hypothetical protein